MEGIKTFGFFKFALIYWNEIDGKERAAKGITCGENYSEAMKTQSMNLVSVSLGLLIFVLLMTGIVMHI